MKILIAEDQRIMAECLELVIRQEFSGCSIKIVTKLEEIMLLLNSEAWDLILLDLTLEDASREQTASQIPDMMDKCKSIVVITGTEESIVRKLVGVPSGIPIAEKPILFERVGMLHKIIETLFPRPESNIGEKSHETAESLEKIDRLLNE